MEESPLNEWQNPMRGVKTQFESPLSHMLPKEIPFRFDEARGGQEQLILDAYHAFQTKQIFLAHAETGLGKTDAALSAALAVALASEPRKTVLFLTPKNAQHAIALEALRGINAKFGLNLRAVDLVGKKHLCVEETAMNREGRTFYEACKKKKEMEACGFYGNARGYGTLQREKAKIARGEFDTQMKGIHSSAEIKQASSEFTLGAQPFGMCPYETSMELAKKADVIIADYYHVFSPSVSELVLPKLGKKPENCILIVDEAHNLPERVRGLMSTNLTTRQLQKAREEAEFVRESELVSLLTEMEETLTKAGEKMGEGEVLLAEDKWKVFFTAKKVDWEEMSLLAEARGVDYLEKSGKESAVLIHVGEFLEKWANEDEGLARVLKRRDYSGDFSISVKALDPRPLTQNVLEKMHACMLMSGTLHPTSMYADVLGVRAEKRKTGFYASPFPSGNKLSLIAPIASTKYTDRSEEAFSRIAMEVGKMVNQIPGNAVVFFPSFKLLENMGNKMKDYTARPLLFQRENMKMQETADLLNDFKQHAHGFGSVLLACTNGSFAEGIDLPGNLLLGVVIVGIPLAEMNVETSALVNYYETRFKKGWHYGYIYPAMGKAIQAAGRVIRTPTDVGTIVFLDKRYAWTNYRDCLPPTQTFVTTPTPADAIKQFWKGKRGGE